MMDMTRAIGGRLDARRRTLMRRVDVLEEAVAAGELSSAWIELELARDEMEHLRDLMVLVELIRIKRRLDDAVAAGA